MIEPFARNVGFTDAAVQGEGMVAEWSFQSFLRG
jgi:hypothetical protein